VIYIIVFYFIKSPQKSFFIIFYIL